VTAQYCRSHWWFHRGHWLHLCCDAANPQMDSCVQQIYKALQED